MTRVTNAEPRRARKKAAVRSSIIAAAIELFTAQGITDVTVDQIAAAADVGKGTIYNYFQTKEDIVVGFMVELERKVQTRLPRLTEGPVDVVLANFIRFQFQQKARYHNFVRVLLAQMFLRTDDFFPYIVDMQKVIDPPLEALFRNLHERGAIRNDLGLPELIQAFKTIHLGLTALWAIEGPPFHQTERALRHQCRLFADGVKGAVS